LPQAHRNRLVFKLVLACGLLFSLSLLNFCFQSWPPAKNRFAPLRSPAGVIDIRILDSGLRGTRSYLYEIRVNQGRVLELENKSISMQEIADPPGKVLWGGNTSPDGQYVSVSPGAGEHLSSGSDQIPIIVERSNDHTPVVQTSIPPRCSVAGASWSADSKAVALLLSSERFGFGPLDLLSAFAGHPIRYKSFGFVILSIDESKSVSVLRFSSAYAGSWAAIEWNPLHD
jgi:hypothetical protein